MVRPRQDKFVTSADGLPGNGLDSAKMPGHWLLSRLGKRVLRPGGLELTRQMLEILDFNRHPNRASCSAVCHAFGTLPVAVAATAHVWTTDRH